MHIMRVRQHVLPAAIQHISIKRAPDSFVRFMPPNVAAEDVFLQIASTVEFMVVLSGYAKKALPGLAHTGFLLGYWC